MTTKVADHPWSSDALFNKASRFVESMEASTPDDWRYGLWAAMSLELLLRAALARVSPVLLADAKDWRNFSYALELPSTQKRFTATSISTTEVLNRLSELVPEFTAEIVGFCNEIVTYRNAELHTGETPFASAGTSRWLPRYYYCCLILLRFMELTLDEFFGDAESIEKVINAFLDKSGKAVEQDIKAHAKVWENRTDTDRSQLSTQASNWATRNAGHRVKCPSCSSQALVSGTSRGAVTRQIRNESIVEKQTMAPASFECVACGLKISGWSKLAACGLGDEFIATTTYTPADYFQLYTEDELEAARAEMPPYEEDFNE